MKMPKEIVQCLGIVVLALTIGLPNGFAELFQGTVSALDVRANTLSIERIDPASGQMMEYKVTVGEDTTFEGASSLKDLEKGDQVVVDASQGATPDVLEANSIELIEGK